MLGRELNFRTYPEIGVTEGHHGLSHHGDRAEQLAKYSKVNTYQAQLFAKLLVNATDARSRVEAKRAFVSMLQDFGPLEARLLQPAAREPHAATRSRPQALQ